MELFPANGSCSILLWSCATSRLTIEFSLQPSASKYGCCVDFLFFLSLAAQPIVQMKPSKKKISLTCAGIGRENVHMANWRNK
eukprot:433322-Pelagomonas_calceolata.AAC.3